MLVSAHLSRVGFHPNFPEEVEVWTFFGVLLKRANLSTVSMEFIRTLDKRPSVEQFYLESVHIRWGLAGVALAGSLLAACHSAASARLPASLTLRNVSFDSS